ncbi:FMN-dependent NADH-azoreductase [Sphingomonas melonis]|uniref:FMN dependent NADH:quinone oxidoreductase n=1 Tax=Sphingomonas melonis TaxID=152682 RepID=A0A7Y9FMZ8_9SPHN|nr:NAD(P)H-dependent oxidoreductase [Sphingomonas melonis]NYD89086.1 FMN-dependent NADH-azoreductase [Sphingomonas melonis]
MKILHIDSSITGAQSVSRQLSAAVVERLGGDGKHEVTYRDVAADELPHFTAVTAPSAHPLSQAVPVLDAAQQAQRATSDAILVEFLDADVVVIGVPMYNFTVPSELKAWIDRVIVPGTTFRKGETGPEGLAGNKRVILAVARGGVYAAGSPFAPAEHAESLLRSLLGFIGVTEIETVVAEGLNFPEARNSAIASARDAARQLAA